MPEASIRPRRRAVRWRCADLSDGGDEAPDASGFRGRALGIDLGERRIGVSMSDSQRLLATPLSVIERCATHAEDHKAIAALVSELDASVVVVGLPLTMAGEMGAAASAAVTESEELQRVLAVPVVLHDERLTTVEADHRRRLATVPPRPETGQRGRPKQRRAHAGPGRRERRVGIDALAATVLLQSWLDQKRSEP